MISFSPLIMFQFSEISIWNIYESDGIIYSKDYPKFLRTNVEYQWIIHMNSSNEIEINLVDINLDDDYDSLQLITGNRNP